MSEIQTRLRTVCPSLVCSEAGDKSVIIVDSIDLHKLVLITASSPPQNVITSQPQQYSGLPPKSTTNIDVVQRQAGSFVRDVVSLVCLSLICYAVYHTVLPSIGASAASTPLFQNTTNFTDFIHLQPTVVTSFISYNKVTGDPDARHCYDVGRTVFASASGFYCGIPSAVGTTPALNTRRLSDLMDSHVVSDVTHVAVGTETDVHNAIYRTSKFHFYRYANSSEIFGVPAEIDPGYPTIVNMTVPKCTPKANYTWNSAYHTVLSTGFLVDCILNSSAYHTAIRNYHRVHVVPSVIPAQLTTMQTPSVPPDANCLNYIPGNPYIANYYDGPRYGKYYTKNNNANFPSFILSECLGPESELTADKWYYYCNARFKLLVSYVGNNIDCMYCGAPTGSPFGPVVMRVWSLKADNSVVGDGSLGNNILSLDQDGIWTYPNGVFVRCWFYAFSSWTFMPLSCWVDDDVWIHHAFGKYCEPYYCPASPCLPIQTETARFVSNNGYYAFGSTSADPNSLPVFLNNIDGYETIEFDTLAEECCAEVQFPFRVSEFTDGQAPSTVGRMWRLNAGNINREYYVPSIPTFKIFGQFIAVPTGIRAHNNTHFKVVHYVSNAGAVALDPICIQTFCFASLESPNNTYWVYYFPPSTQKINNIPTQPTLARLGQYASSAYAPYLTVGIESITDVLSGQPVHMERCSSFLTCMLLPPAYYHVEYHSTFAVVANTINNNTMLIQVHPVHSNFRDIVPVHPLDLSASTSFSVETGHVTIRWEEGNIYCPFLGNALWGDFCMPDAHNSLNLSGITNHTYLSVNAAKPSTALVNGYSTYLGHYSQTIIFNQSENSYLSFQFPYFFEPVIVPTPIVQWSLVNQLPSFSIVNVPGAYGVTYNCHGTSHNFIYNNYDNTLYTIPCNARIIPVHMSSGSFNWTYDYRVYRNSRFNSLDDTMSWRYKNPPAFWATVSLLIVFSPFLIWFLFQMVLPFGFFLFLYTIRVCFACFYVLRIPVLRFHPSFSSFWNAVGYSGSFTFFIGTKSPTDPSLQLKRPGVPKLHWTSPYAHMAIVSVCLTLLTLSGTEAVMKRSVQIQATLANAVYDGSQTTQNTRADTPNEFGDLDGFTYTVQSISGNNGTVLIDFEGAVGANEKLTYQPSSTTSGALLRNPIIVKFNDVTVTMTPTFMYNTGPTATEYRVGCSYFFSQRCDFSDLKTRPGYCGNDIVSPFHRYHISYSSCCPDVNAYAVASTCLDPKKVPEWISCFNIQSYRYNIAASVVVDGVEYPASTTGEQFVAGSCRGVLTVNTDTITLPGTVCCNAQTCKTCSAPLPGNIAPNGELGDVQNRFRTTISSPLNKVTRTMSNGIHCVCSMTGEELGGYKRFNDTVVCQDHLPNKFGCMAMKHTYVKPEQQGIDFYNCKQTASLKMLCQANVVPVVVEPMLENLSILCPEGIYGSSVGVVCNYTITNTGSSAVVVKPICTISNAVSPMIACADFTVNGGTTSTCGNCISITSNVAELIFDTAIVGTNIKLRTTLRLNAPPGFTPAQGGGEHTLVYNHCSYLTKLGRAFKHFGTWVNANKAFFGVFFSIVIGGYILCIALSILWKLHWMFTVLYSGCVIAVCAILCLVLPAVTVVPGCEA